jgi:hypothetical protein
VPATHAVSETSLGMSVQLRLLGGNERRLVHVVLAYEAPYLSVHALWSLNGLN